MDVVVFFFGAVPGRFAPIVLSFGAMPGRFAPIVLSFAPCLVVLLPSSSCLRRHVAGAGRSAPIVFGAVPGRIAPIVLFLAAMAGRTAPIVPFFGAMPGRRYRWHLFRTQIRKRRPKSNKKVKSFHMPPFFENSPLIK